MADLLSNTQNNPSAPLPSQLTFIVNDFAGQVAVISAVGNLTTFTVDGVTIRPDVSLSEEHTYTAEVTDHPVENGASFSDHIIIKPFMLSVEAIITEDALIAPFVPAGLTLSGVAGIRKSLSQAPLVGDLLSSVAVPLIGQGNQQFVVTPPNEFSQTLARQTVGRHFRAYQVIKKIFTNKTPITIVTALDRYDNMVMHKLRTPRSYDVGTAVKFSAEFKQIITGDILVSPSPAGALAIAGASQTSKGSQGDGKTATEEEVKNTSFLVDIVDSAAGAN